MDPNIDKVLYRIDVNALKHKVLLYLSPEDLIALRQKLQQHQDLLKELAASPTLQNLLGVINLETTTALVGHVFTEFLEEDEKEKDPLDLSVLLALLRERTSGWPAIAPIVRPGLPCSRRTPRPFRTMGFCSRITNTCCSSLQVPRRKPGSSAASDGPCSRFAPT
jgi:hypothetical protein